MGAILGSDKLSAALFGKTRRALLALFFSQPDRSFYLREASRLLGNGQGMVQRELKNLSDAGILSRTVRGNQVYFQANHACPIFKELMELTAKTSGLAFYLKKALFGISNKIELAFIYGSLAKGEAKPGSDVDLLVVGDVDDLLLHRAISRVEGKLGRAVNYTLLSRREFRKRRKEKQGFLDRVISGPRIPIIGEENAI